MNKYSRNNKLNKVLCHIEDDLIELGIEEIKRYYNDFKREPDYNIAQYGNLRIYYDDIRRFYTFIGGYKNIDKMSDAQVWELYKRQVGYVAHCLIMEG